MYWQLIIGLAVYIVLGTVVLAVIDDDDQRLFRWIKECPFGPLFIMAIWPSIIYFWYNPSRLHQLVEYLEKRQSKGGRE